MFGEIVDKSSISFILKLKLFYMNISTLGLKSLSLLEIFHIVFHDILTADQGFSECIDDVPPMVVQAFIIIMPSGNFFAVSLI